MAQDSVSSDIADDDVAEGGEQVSVAVEAASAGERLDKFLAQSLADRDISRTRVKDMLLAGDVMMDGQLCDDPSLKIKAGMVFSIVIPEPVDDVPVPENIPINIVFEDDDLLVINKQAGLVVHPAPGHRTGTLVNALLHHCGDTLSGIGGVRRPGIVHRLDKDTTGLIIVAKNDHAHHLLSAQLADRSLSRRYYAVVWGVPGLKKGTVNLPIARHSSNRQKMAIAPRGGREAVTHYERLHVFRDSVSLIECKLETGRTHQVRVHMQASGHPLIGDPVYGQQVTASRALMKKDGFAPEIIETLISFPRQALHARQISFIHPTLDEEMTFDATLPDDLNSIISILKQ